MVEVMQSCGPQALGIVALINFLVSLELLVPLVPAVALAIGAAALRVNACPAVIC